MEVLAEITSEELATIAYDLYVFRLVTVSSRRNNVCFFFHRMAAKMFSLASCGEAHQRIWSPLVKLTVASQSYAILWHSDYIRRGGGGHMG